MSARPKVNDDEVKDVARIRFDDDVKLLVQLAFRHLSGKAFKNINRMGNQGLRALLTPLVGNKRVRAMQEESGVSVNHHANGK